MTRPLTEQVRNRIRGAARTTWSPEDTARNLKLVDHLAEIRRIYAEERGQA